MSKPSCPKCGNSIDISCEHVASNTCIECERDDNHVIIDGECFFCLCEGKSKDKFEYKPRVIMYRALEVVKLGKMRRKLGLHPPKLVNTFYDDLYELFMSTYNID